MSKTFSLEGHKEISYEDLMVGDIVFYSEEKGSWVSPFINMLSKIGVTHVGIVIGTGDSDNSVRVLDATSGSNVKCRLLNTSLGNGREYLLIGRHSDMGDTHRERIQDIANKLIKNENLYSLSNVAWITLIAITKRIGLRTIGNTLYRNLLGSAVQDIRNQNNQIQFTCIGLVYYIFQRLEISFKNTEFELNFLLNGGGLVVERLSQNIGSCHMPYTVNIGDDEQIVDCFDTLDIVTNSVFINKEFIRGKVTVLNNKNVEQLFQKYQQAMLKDNAKLMPDVGLKGLPDRAGFTEKDTENLKREFITAFFNAKKLGGNENYYVEQQYSLGLDDFSAMMSSYDHDSPEDYVSLEDYVSPYDGDSHGISIGTKYLSADGTDTLSSGNDLYSVGVTAHRDMPLNAAYLRSIMPDDLYESPSIAIVGKITKFNQPTDFSKK